MTDEVCALIPVLGLLGVVAFMIAATIFEGLLWLVR